MYSGDEYYDDTITSGNFSVTPDYGYTEADAMYYRDELIEAGHNVEGLSHSDIIYLAEQEGIIGYYE